MQGVGPGRLIGDRYLLQERRTHLEDIEVWQAVDTQLGREVSLTLLRSDHPRAEPLLDAARRVAGLDDSRLIRILDVGRSEHPVGGARDSEDPGPLSWVVEESIRTAPSVAQLLHDGPLPAEEVRRITGEIAGALDAAARRGLHHLNITPYAVRRTADGRIKLAGLATSAAIEDNDEADSATALAADTRGLLAVTYAALTGRWPLRGHMPGLEPAPRIVGGVPAPSELVAAVPGDLDVLCRDAVNGRGGPQHPGALAAQIAPWPARQVTHTGPQDSELAGPSTRDDDDAPVEVAGPGAASPWAADDPDSTAVLPRVGSSTPKGRGAAAQTAAGQEAAEAADTDSLAIVDSSVTGHAGAAETDPMAATRTATADGSTGESLSRRVSAWANRVSAALSGRADTADASEHHGDAETRPDSETRLGEPAQRNSAGAPGSTADSAAAPDEATGGRTAARIAGAGAAGVAGAAGMAGAAGVAKAAGVAGAGAGLRTSTPDTPGVVGSWPGAPASSRSTPGPKNQRTDTERTDTDPAQDRPASTDQESSVETGPSLGERFSGLTRAASSKADALRAQLAQERAARAERAAQRTVATEGALAGGAAASTDAARLPGDAATAPAAANATKTPTASTSAKPTTAPAQRRPWAAGQAASTHDVSAPRPPRVPPRERVAPLVPTRPGHRDGSHAGTILGIVGALLVIALILAWRTVLPSGVTSANPKVAGSVKAEARSSAAASAARPKIAISSGTGFDPYGDGTENGGLASLAYDGDPDTMWQSEGYRNSPVMGGTKSGVGVIFTLPRGSTVKDVRLTLPDGAQDLSVYAANEQSLDGATRMGTATNATGITSMSLPKAVAARYVIVWFTKCAPDNDRYRCFLPEIAIS